MFVAYSYWLPHMVEFTLLAKRTAYRTVSQMKPLSCTYIIHLCLLFCTLKALEWHYSEIYFIAINHALSLPPILQLGTTILETAKATNATQSPIPNKE